MTGPVTTEALVESFRQHLAGSAIYRDGVPIRRLEQLADALIAGPLAPLLAVQQQQAASIGSLEESVNGLEAAHQQVTAERDEARALVAKFTSGCPWDGPRSEYEAINPEQPCPVCGDLGTWNFEDQKPSRCVASAHSRKEWREVTATSELARRAPQGAEISQAATDVLAERRRQVEAEGWTPEHDDAHSRCEIASAAACYATAPSPVGIEREWVYPDTPKAWPWHSSWWRPGFYRRNLVKAAALLIAEIERWDRLEARTALDRAATAREGA